MSKNVVVFYLFLFFVKIEMLGTEVISITPIPTVSLLLKNVVESIN